MRSMFKCLSEGLVIGYCQLFIAFWVSNIKYPIPNVPLWHKILAANKTFA